MSNSYDQNSYFAANQQQRGYPTTNQNNAPAFNNSNQTFCHSSGTSAGVHPGNFQGASFLYMTANSVPKYNDQTINSYTLHPSNAGAIEENFANVGGFYASITEGSRVGQQQVGWNNQKQRIMYSVNDHNNIDHHSSYRLINQNLLHSQRNPNIPPPPPPPPPSYPNVPHMLNNPIGSASNTDYFQTQNYMQLSMPPPPPPPPTVAMGVRTALPPAPPTHSTPASLLPENPNQTHSQKHKSVVRTSAAAKKRSRWGSLNNDIDKPPENDRSSRRLKQLQHVKKSRSESDENKSKLNATQSDKNQRNRVNGTKDREMKDDLTVATSPSAAISAAIVGGTSNFHVATLCQPSDRESPGFQENERDDRIDNAMGALSVLESRWSNIGLLPQEKTGNKKNKKKKRNKNKKKKLNKNKSPNNVVKEPVLLVKDLKNTEDKKHTINSEVIDLDSPELQPENFGSLSASLSEKTAGIHETAELSEATRTYSSVLQQGPPENPTASDKRGTSAVVKIETKHTSFVESGNDEMDISDEDDESPNESHNDTKEISSAAESLYRDLPDALIQIERGAAAGSSKGCENLHRSVSDPSAAAWMEGSDMIPNASEFNVKERRILKLAELKAKAKLAQAKLRMARRRKPRIELSFDPREGEIKVDDNESEATKPNDSSSSENDFENNHSHSKLSPITAVTEVKSLVIDDVWQTGPNEKVRYVDSVYELGFDEKHPSINLTSDNGITDTSSESLGHTKPDKTMFDIGATENHKKSEALKQQLHLAKLRLELRKKQQLLVAKKKMAPQLSSGEAKTDTPSSTSDLAPLTSPAGVNSEFRDESNASGAKMSGLLSKQNVNALEHRRSMLHKLRERRKELIAKKANSEAQEKQECQYTLHDNSFPADPGDCNVESEKKIDEGYSPSSNREDRDSAHTIEIEQENSDDHIHQNKELKRKNDLTTLRSLILRQRDSLREQGKELADNSAQLQACSDEITSKQKMLDTSEAKLQDMQHRKRILEGMIYRATEKLMESRQALNEYKKYRQL
ncbi:hypothetical protein ACHAXS_011021 [Conticribra weissflogii]